MKKIEGCRGVTYGSLGYGNAHDRSRIVGLALLVGISSTLLTSVSYCSEQRTSVILFGTWLAFEFIHVPFFFSLFYFRSLPLCHYLSVFLSVKRCSIRREKPFSSHRMYIILHTVSKHSRNSSFEGLLALIQVAKWNHWISKIPLYLLRLEATDGAMKFIAGISPQMVLYGNTMCQPKFGQVRSYGRLRKIAAC